MDKSDIPPVGGAVRMTVHGFDLEGTVVSVDTDAATAIVRERESRVELKDIPLTDIRIRRN